MTQPKIRSYRDLVTWQRAMQLAEASYGIASSLPIEDRFGLAQQIRRAAVSIPSNIAEGHNGRSRPVFLNHLAIALGSQAELETELELAHRLWKTDISRAQALAGEVGRLLTDRNHRAGGAPAGHPPLDSTLGTYTVVLLPYGWGVTSGCPGSSR